MGHGHGHHHTAERLRWALAANVLVVVAQVAFGLAAHSVALLADAAHNLTDVAAVGLALGAVRLARRAPTEGRSYGWVRGGVLAAQANALAVVGLSALLLYASVERLRSPSPVRGGLVLAVAGVAFVVNGLAAWGLRRERDLGARSAWLHLAGDALASLVVAVTGLVIAVTGRFDRLDAVASALVAVLILGGGWALLRQTNAVLLEGTPRGVSPADVAATMAAVPGVESVHDLHVWSLDGARHALSVHVVVAGHPSLEEAQVVATEVKRAVSAPFGIAHATVELECEGCVDDGAWCAFG
ncbi:MAG TPA: cation diffusion facilitator family transporter [Mycobacteriales bacterium]|jgi:cobalt-zinc-cadmium efflux system protein|nr:cation diffusion facilitator family transporter [Mycobacteriales bacterium]